ncbi:lantibiotic dehydratase [Streptomyces sp. NPDC005438]|uniref:lantibiotic dehydratase n=1 Tax=Streptomyces sp. NPDC005438 TaxID=3156880 RepID=UPI0033B8DCFE
MPHQSDTGEDPGPLFRAGGWGVVRTAALPASHPCAARTRAPDPEEPDGPDEPGEPRREAEEREQLTALVRDLVKDPQVREAVEVSSPSLARSLTRIEDGTGDGTPLSTRRTRRLALSVIRYALRMTGRPTPFGLLAGVGGCRFTEDLPPEPYGDEPVPHKHARADAGWLDAVVRRLHHDEGVRDRLLLVANHLCRERAGRLVLPYVRGERAPGDPVPHELTFGYGPVVRAAVEAAATPLTYQALRRALLERFPEAAREDVERLLNQLIDREVLLTDLASAQNHPDLLRYVNSRLDGAASPTATRLRLVERELRDYSATAPGQGREHWSRLLATMGEAHTELTGERWDAARSPVQVDLALRPELALPADLAAEVAGAAEVLWRLGPEEGGPLGEYHRAFLERYGLERPVPVRELLDPHLGLGPPAGYQVPHGDRPAPTPATVPYSPERDEALGDAVQRTLAQGPGAELVLDRDLVRRLAPERPAGVVPGSLDLCVQPLARGFADLAAGDYRLLVSGGSYAAGSMAGRFAHLLDAEEELAGLWEHPEDGADAPPTPVQLFFTPLGPRSPNVSRVPQVVPAAVRVGCCPSVDDDPEHTVPLDDLVVSSDGDRLRLARASTGREVTVARPHMLNMATEAPNLARFLAGVGMSGSRPWAPWQWSRLEALPQLPRVRHGRTVLSPARWRPPPALRDGTLSARRWRSALESWREQAALPQVLRVKVHDHHLDLDLSSAAHRRVLRAELTGPAAPVVQESPLAEPADLGWSRGRVTEVVVPLLPTSPRPAATLPTAVRPAAPTPHPPGGEWLYAKLYVARDRMDSLLVRELAALCGGLEEDLDRWFFLRYADPAPHLRLRMRGTPDSLRNRVLPALHDWAATARTEGLIGTLTLGTYEPETERYGGPEALADAERLFHADSRLVTAHLTARARGELPVPAETLAAADHAATLDALGTWDWRSWVLDTFPRELENRSPVAARRQATRWIDTTRAVRLDPALDPPRLNAPRAEAARAAEAYGHALGVAPDTPPRWGPAVAGVLHMHANRLLGTDRETEQRAYGLLRAVVRAHRDREAHR